MQFLAEFLGHFHPVIVHLPIGILLIASLFYALASTKRYAALKPAVSFSFLIGMISAVLACVTGWLLSTTDDYDSAALTQHQWVGIATAIIGAICYAFERRNAKYLSVVVVILVLMVSVTGHLGGTLTHGEGYLTAAFDNYPEESIKPISNVQDALIYEDVIQPILSTKCSRTPENSADGRGAEKRKSQVSGGLS